MKILPPPFRWFVFSSLIFSSLLSGAALAQKPIPSGKEAPVHADWDKRWLKHRLKQVELYKKHTKDPVKVRADAMRFIREMNINREKLHNDHIRNSLQKLANKIKSNGSADPLVKFHIVRFSTQENNAERAITEFKEAVKGFRSSTYPTEIQFRAIENLRHVLSVVKADAKFNPYFKEYFKLGLKLLSDNANQPETRRVQWAQFLYFMKSDRILKQQKAFYEAVQKQKKVDPFIREMIAGTYHHKLAWDYRGGGWASEVKKEFWPLFQKHLKISAIHFKKAWQIDPTIPHPPTKLIGIAMAGGSDESPRTWFDRAVVAEMDFEPAYDALRWSIRPRWGGSHSAMYQFGVECASTRRYDTKVPWQFISILLEIDQELQGKGIAFQKPGIYARTKYVLENFANHPNWADSLNKGLFKSWAMSIHVIIAIHAGEFKDARKLLDQLGDKFVPKAVTKLSRLTFRDISMVYALTGKGGKEVASIQKILEKESLDKASRKQVSILLSIAIKKTKSPKAKLYFDYWSQQLQGEEAFAKGEWVPVKFDANLTNWKITKGNWKVENEKSVVASSELPGQAFKMTYLGKFPVPFEIRCDVEVLKVTSPRPWNRFYVGFTVGDMRCPHPAPRSGRLFWVEPHKKHAGYIGPCGDPGSLTIKPQKVNHLHLIAGREESNYFVNGTHFSFGKSSDKITAEDFRTFVPGQIGLGTATWLSQSGIVRFSNLRIKKFPWDKAPAWKDNDARIKYFSYILKDEPNPSIFRLRGIAYDHTHDSEKAIADFNEAIRLSPKYALAYYSRGIVWYNQGKYDKAIADYSEAVRLNPKSHLAYSNLGSSWKKKGDIDKAILNFNKSIRIKPTAITLNERGLSWDKKEQYGKAMADFTEAIRMNQKFANAYNNRGKAWQKKGNKTKAEADFKKAKELGYKPPGPAKNTK